METTNVHSLKQLKTAVACSFKAAQPLFGAWAAALSGSCLWAFTTEPACRNKQPAATVRQAKHNNSAAGHPQKAGHELKRWLISAKHCC